jgi:hypothetical protein
MNVGGIKELSLCCCFHWFVSVVCVDVYKMEIVEGFWFLDGNGV